MSIKTFSASFTGVVDSIRSLQIVKGDATLDALLTALTSTAGDLTTRANNTIVALEAYRDSQCPPKAGEEAVDLADLLGSLFGTLSEASAATVAEFGEVEQTEPTAEAEVEAEAPNNNPFTSLLMHFEGKVLRTNLAAIAKLLNEKAAQVTAAKPSNFDLNGLLVRGLKLAETGYDAVKGGALSGDTLTLDMSLLQHPLVQEIAGEVGVFSLIPHVMSLAPSMDEIGAAYKRNRSAGIGAAAISVVVGKVADKVAVGGTQKVASYLEGEAVKAEAKLLLKLVKALEIEGDALVDACRSMITIAQARCYADIWQHGTKATATRKEYAGSLGDMVGELVGPYLQSVSHVPTPMGCSVGDLMEMLAAQFAEEVPSADESADDTSTATNDDGADTTPLDPNAVIEPTPCLVGDHAADGPENPPAANDGTDGTPDTCLIGEFAVGYENPPASNAGTDIVIPNPTVVIEPSPCLVGDHAADGPEAPAIASEEVAPPVSKPRPRSPRSTPRTPRTPRRPKTTGDGTRE